ncbi:MAG: alanine racemase, partial [Spirochaetales bacterium]|nr:alanine racemase [Spirochaetales bacterium]
NIRVMRKKAERSGVLFRPHFKTHQSALVGEWYREQGVKSITVSSVKMGMYFASHGWEDITIAFPVNTREIDDINDLAGRVKLNLLVLTPEIAEQLSRELVNPVGIWIKVDTGYGRTGIPWGNREAIVDLSRKIEELPGIEFQGLLTHAGHTYHIYDVGERTRIFRGIADGMGQLRDGVLAAGLEQCLISVGDTPGATAAEDFSGVDEVRPGNFVYFDAQQLHLGSCDETEVAAAVACPVVAVHKDRSELILYGGAIHLSAQPEDHPEIEGQRMYGYVVEASPDGWGAVDRYNYVKSVSQEHGVARVDAMFLSKVKPGDLVGVIPVHSCLAVDLLDRGITTGSQFFDLDMV